jgi:ribosomal protein L14E/L6E/L27E
MENLKIGKIVKTKKGDACVVVDILDDEAIIFNITKMHPDKIKIKEIKEIIGEANCTTMVVDGKKVTVKNHEEEKVEADSNENQDSDNLEEKEENDTTERFGEMVKAFGQAAIALGNILVDIAKEEEDEQ